MKQRKITDKLFEEYRRRLALNGLAQHFIATKNARGLFVQAANCMVGVKEATGKNDGEWVEEFQKTVDFKAQGEPWCMAFIQSCIAYVERELGVVSRFPVTEHCQTAWRDVPSELRVKNIPLPGAIAIWARVGTSSGHTEVLQEYIDGKYFPAVGGNTSGYVIPVKNGKSSVNREGNGVFYTWRKHGIAGDLKLLGFAKPF